MVNNNDDKEIRALVVHIDYLREQMDEFKKQVSALTSRLERTATTGDLEALEARLKKQIDENSPNAVFWTITKVAAGIVSIAAAVGVFLALTKVLTK